jgi:hypothetical protein
MEGCDWNDGDAYHCQKSCLAVSPGIEKEAAMALPKELKTLREAKLRNLYLLRSIYWRETPGLGIEAKEHAINAHAGASCRALKKEKRSTIIHLKFILSTLICRDSCLESVESSFAGDAPRIRDMDPL